MNPALQEFSACDESLRMTSTIPLQCISSRQGFYAQEIPAESYRAKK